MGRYDVKSESLERVSRLRVDGLRRLTLLASRPERVRHAKLVGGVPRRHVTEATNSQRAEVSRRRLAAESGGDDPDLAGPEPGAVTPADSVLGDAISRGVCGVAISCSSAATD